MDPQLTNLLFATCLAAVLAYFFDKRLQSSAQRWEEKRHLIKTVENLCDEIMGEATLYWTNEVNDENFNDMECLTAKIVVHTQLLRSFIFKNFPNSQDVKHASIVMIHSVTGGEFGADKREPKPNQVKLAVSSLATLRLTVSQKSANTRQPF